MTREPLAGWIESGPFRLEQQIQLSVKKMLTV